MASTRRAIQAVGGVQITATKNEGVRVRATDMDIGLSLPLDAAVVTDGTAVLPARLLLDVAKSMSGRDASLELRPVEQHVEVLSGSASFHIRAIGVYALVSLASGHERVNGAAIICGLATAMCVRSANLASESIRRSRSREPGGEGSCRTP